MAYSYYDSSKPTASGTVNDLVTDTRVNLMALRDMVVMQANSGWNYSWTGGDAAEPTTVRYTNGVERLEVTLTWGTSGGEDGNVTAALWRYTADHTAGPTWETIGTENVLYDVDGNVTSTNWTI